MFVSNPHSTAPNEFLNDLQKLSYKTLAENSIDFLRVDCEDGTTMEACRQINSALDAQTVKTLFLSNRQKTVFYLYVTEGEKPFVTKDFSAALGISRVSFAPEEMLFEKLHTTIGATTIMSCLLDTAKDVNLIVDKSVYDASSFCCTDGTNTGFFKISGEDFRNKLFPLFKLSKKLI